MPIRGINGTSIAMLTTKASAVFQRFHDVFPTVMRAMSTRPHADENRRAIDIKTIVLVPEEYPVPNAFRTSGAATSTASASGHVSTITHAVETRYRRRAMSRSRDATSIASRGCTAYQIAWFPIWPTTTNLVAAV